MKKNNRRKLFDNSEPEIYLPTNVAEEVLAASDDNSGLDSCSSSEDEDWRIPRATRWAKYSRQISDFLNSHATILPFPSDLTSYERHLIHRMAEQNNLDHESYGEGNDRFITVRKKNVEGVCII